jgi:hypothetical protein
MRRLPGPADSPLCEGVHTPEAHVELFRGWQRTQTQSSVRTLRSLRQQMDVWFCLMQESSAERHCCVTADPDQTHCAPSGARAEILCFSLDFDLHRWGHDGKAELLGLPVLAKAIHVSLISRANCLASCPSPLMPSATATLSNTRGMSNVCGAPHCPPSTRERQFSS